MKQLLKRATALILIGALTGLVSYAFSQNGHNENGHEAEAHAEDSHDDHNEHEGHDEHGEEGHSDEVTLSEQAISLFNIRTVQAERRTLAGTTTVPARVGYNTEAMAHISTQVQGRVQQISVRLGDEVEEGQLLLEIDSPELGTAQSNLLQQEAAVEAARTRVEAAQALVEVARTAFDRAETLRESNSISITEYLDRQGAMRKAEANVRKAEADLRVAESARLAAENQLHIYGVTHETIEAVLTDGEVSTRYEVRAPIAGKIVEREVTPGEVVDSSQDALMVLANMEELWVLGDVAERHLARVSQGTPARLTMTALPDMAFEGTVSYIAPQLAPRTRTATVRIVVPSGSEEEGESLLRPGMFGQAELSLKAMAGQAQEAILAVPEEAIQTVEGGPAVFVPVEGEANTFAKRAIQIGPRVGSWVPVLSGLEEGESYIPSNTFILKAELGKAGAGHAH